MVVVVVVRRKRKSAVEESESFEIDGTSSALNGSALWLFPNATRGWAALKWRGNRGPRKGVSKRRELV